MTSAGGTYKARSDSSGFTLIELLVVIAIIGLLSSIVLASLNTARARGRDARRVADMHSVVQALELYANDNKGRYPANPTSDFTGACGGQWSCVGDLTILVTNKYIPSLPADPIYANTASNYRYCQDNGAYILLLWSERKNNWCRPQAPVTMPLPTGCTWTSFPSC